MSVESRERRDGTITWVVRWRVDGVAKSESFSEADFGRKAQSLAHKLDLEIKEQIKTTGVVTRNRGAKTIGKIWQDWYDAGCQEWTEATQDAYASAMDVHILPYFAARQVAAVTPADIERWTAKLRRDGVGPSAVRKAATVLSSLMSYAVRDRMIDTNPVQAAKKPAASREREPVKVTPEQVEQLRAWFLWQGLRGDATLISLLAYSGPRPESEGIVLDWRHVGRQRITYLPSRKRGAKLRHVDLLAPLHDDLMDWRRHTGRIGGLVLPFGDGGVSPFGDAWTAKNWDHWRRNRFNKAAEAVGLPAHVVPRDLRGSFATLLIRSGHDVINAARQCGHKPSMFLDTYAGEFADYDPTRRIDPVETIYEARVLATLADFGADLLARHVADPAARKGGELVRVRAAGR